MNSITIIDYGMGNLRSISNKLRKIGVSSVITSGKEEILKAKKLILPGVGAFNAGMEHLTKLDLVDVLNKKVLEEKTPVLGICLGMQLFTTISEEGNVKGLNWIDAETVKFKISDAKYKIPHIGWNNFNTKRESKLISGLNPDSFFYFVHSFYIKCNDENNVIGITNYENEFHSIIEKDNIYGTQFHPEKSHEYGLKLLKNFAENV